MPTTKTSVKKAATSLGKPAKSVKTATVKQGSLLQKRKAPSFITLQNEMVTIYVTNAERKVFKFVVHKSFICYASPFLDVAFSGTLVEGQTQSIKLETSEQAFGMLVDYAYSSCTKFCQRAEGTNQYYNASCCPDETEGCPPPEHINHLIDVWLLADKLLMPKLQNVVMDQIYSLSQVLFRDDGEDVQIINFNLVYANTTEGSPLRHLAVMLFNSCCADDNIEYLADLPRKMVLELYANFHDHHGNIDFDYEGTAGYHVSDAAPTLPVVKMEENS